MFIYECITLRCDLFSYSVRLCKKCKMVNDVNMYNFGFEKPSTVRHWWILPLPISHSFSELNGNERPWTLRVRGSPKKDKKTKRYRTGSFWLNNNNLKNVNGLRNLTNLLFQMADYLSWLDVSNNNLTVISDVSIITPITTASYRPTTAAVSQYCYHKWIHDLSLFERIINLNQYIYEERQ